MAKIRIVYSGVTSANRTLRKTLTELGQLSDETAVLYRSIPSAIQSQRQIAQRLRMCSNLAASTTAQAKRLLQTVEQGAAKYENAEASLRRTVNNKL